MSPLAHIPAILAVLVVPHTILECCLIPDHHSRLSSLIQPRALLVQHEQMQNTLPDLNLFVPLDAADHEGTWAMLPSSRRSIYQTVATTERTLDTITDRRLTALEQSIEQAIARADIHVGNVTSVSTNHIYICTIIVIVLVAYIAVVAYNSRKEFQAIRSEHDASIQRALGDIQKQSQELKEWVEEVRKVEILETQMQESLTASERKNKEQDDKVKELDAAMARAQVMLATMGEVVRTHEPSSVIKSQIVTLLLDYRGWPARFHHQLTAAGARWLEALDAKPAADSGT
jgi:hypothetical protein